MPDYSWERQLPAAINHLFANSAIAEQVVITGGVALADWWTTESTRLTSHGEPFELQPRYPTSDIDTVVHLADRHLASDSSLVHVICSEPETLRDHLLARSWIPIQSQAGFTYKNEIDHPQITVDLVSYRGHEGNRTVQALVAIPDSETIQPAPSVAHVLPPCLVAARYVQPFSHPDFCRLKLRRHNHPGLLLAKLSAVGTNIVRWQQVIVGSRPWPKDLTRLIKDAKDLEDLLHLQVRDGLTAHKESFQSDLGYWAWAVHALQSEIPHGDATTDPPVMARTRAVIRIAQMAVRQWLASMGMMDVIEKATSSPPHWTGTEPPPPPRRRTGKNLGSPPIS